MAKPTQDDLLDALDATRLALLGWLDGTDEAMDDERRQDFAALARATELLVAAGRLEASEQQSAERWRKRAGL